MRPSQQDVYQLLRREKYPFIEAARRWGKTTSILVYVLEELRRNPGWVARWCEPFKNQAREIVMPEMKKLMADCPKHLRFEWKTTDSYFEGPGESRLYLRGVNEDKGESARGPFAHIIVADEYGSWVDADYIRKDVLRPQIDTTNGKLIIASTPAKNLGHIYYDLKLRAIQRGRFIKKTIYDNESYTPEKIKEIAEECGGFDSDTFRREYLCEPVADSKSLVIPEYHEELHDFAPDKTSRPHYFDTYVGVDLGLNDNTAFLFGYYDFQTATIYIEDEWLDNGKNTQEIVEAAKAKELALWGEKAPFRRIGDNELQQLYDMQTQFGYTILPTRKDDKLAAINALRVRFREGKIKISSRCESLRFQLKVGLWNERRTDFLRGDKTGHLDAIDALIYLNRNLDLHHNPYPPLGVGDYNVVTNPNSVPTQDGEALKRAFRPFG